MKHQPDGVELMDSVYPAIWIEEQLWEYWIAGRGTLVGSVIPAGFES